ncbi:Uncharacterised protein [Candidatus Anstonella stagnisolia]|nr:Uncharacterised protein [Candidatus Anstonella stagnisolia]
MRCKFFPIFLPANAEDSFIKTYTHIVGTEFYPYENTGMRNWFLKPR